jgi:hypothetical protein
MLLLKGYSIMQKEGSLGGFIKSIHPQFQWNENLFKQNTKKSQKLIYRMLGRLLPPFTLIYFDYIHPNIEIWDQHLMELDLYVPSLNLALEYDGEQHFESNEFFGSSNKQQIRDNVKSSICKKHNITLLRIPYWWNMEMDELRRTIKHHRPDILFVDEYKDQQLEL